ncbi:hypothetical protein ABK040_004079 [Willaertia magna]
MSITVTPPIQWQYDDIMVDQCNYAPPLYIQRAHRIPPSGFWRIYLLGTIFGFALVFYVCIFALVIIRRNKSPLKDRSPYLLLVSAVAGSLGLAYMYSRLYLDLALVCPITYYVVAFALITYFVPYLFRCFRTIMQWKLAKAKAELMDSNQPSSTPNDKKPVKKVKEESATVDVELVEEGRKGGNKKFKSVAKNEKYAKLIASQFYFSERFLIIVLIVLLAVWALLVFIIHMIVLFGGNSLNPSCQKRCNEHEGIALRAFIGFTILLIIPFAILLFMMRNINDDFSIRNEMIIMFVFAIMMAIPLIVLAATPGAFWPESATVGYFIGILLFGSFLISVIYPLGLSLLRTTNFSTLFKFNKADETTVQEVSQAKVPQHETFDFYLTDSEAREVFKQFLVREFSVENLMFYTEVQYFKQLEQDDETLKETAQTIYDTYVQLGAPFEINVPQPLRDEVRKSMDKPNLSIFDQTENAVKKTMEEESFVRFKKSRLFQNFITKFQK